MPRSACLGLASSPIISICPPLNPNNGNYRWHCVFRSSNLDKHLDESVSRLVWVSEFRENLLKNSILVPQPCNQTVFLHGLRPPPTTPPYNDRVTNRTRLKQNIKFELHSIEFPVLGRSSPQQRSLPSSGQILVSIPPECVTEHLKPDASDSICILLLGAECELKLGKFGCFGATTTPSPIINYRGRISTKAWKVKPQPKHRMCEARHATDHSIEKPSVPKPSIEDPSKSRNPFVFEISAAKFLKIFYWCRGANCSRETRAASFRKRKLSSNFNVQCVWCDHGFPQNFKPQFNYQFGRNQLNSSWLSELNKHN